MLFGTLVLASVPEAYAGSSGGSGKYSLASHPHLNTAPSASGAVNSYLLNHNFDINIVAAGAGPTNSGFEVAASRVGAAPTNAGTPPANSTFATGDFTGWTTSGGPTIQTDPTHGKYAVVNWTDAITSSPFTVDPTTQAFTVDSYYPPGYNAMWVYILSGSGYGTVNQIAYLNSNAGGPWRTDILDVSAYKNQSVEIQFKAAYSTVGVTNVHGQVLFPGWTVAGSSSRATEQGGNTYAGMHGGSLTTSSFTVDPTAQYGSLRIYGLSGSGNSYTIKVLSGTNYATATQVASGYATPSVWSTIPFNIVPWQGQPVAVQVIQTTYDIGIDEVGLQQIAVAGWTPNGNASEISGGPTGNYVSTDNVLTSNAFTLDPSVQQLKLDYKGVAPATSFYVKLLSGANFSTVTDIGGYIVADVNNWATKQMAVQGFAGQPVKLQLVPYQGSLLADNAGIGTAVIAGWTVAATGPVAGGQDAKGNYVSPLNNGAFDLTSAPINPGVISPAGSPGYHYYALSYDIGYSTGNLLQVTWTDTASGDANAGKSWVVSSQAADHPTGYTTTYFWLYDYMGPQGTLTIHLTGGGKLYSIGDNIARQQVSEPFSQKVGLQIDTSTGAFAFQDHDLDTQGGPLPLTLTRYYNGHSGQAGELGYRWTHTYDIHLDLVGDGSAGMEWGSGKQEFFGWDWVHTVFTPVDARSHDTLVKNGDGTYTFTATQGNLTYKFTSTGKLTSISDLKGNSITLTYDGNGRLTTVTDPGGRALNFAYNANGTVANVTDPTNARMVYGYDGTTGDLTSVTDPNGKVRGYTYDRHRLVSFTDANGKTQFTNTFDPVDRVIKQTDSTGKSINVAYGTPAAGVTQVTDPNNNADLYYFDRYHRTTDQVDPQAHVISYIFDGSGNLQKIVDPAFNAWQFVYDSSGAVTSATDPLNNPTAIAYNPQHLPTTITDPCNHTTTNGYDSQGNLTSLRDPLGNTMAYSYDSHGNQLTETDALNHTTTSTYDAQNNRASKTDALGNVWRWTYDPKGNVLTQTDPDGNVTTNFYDLDGHHVGSQDATGARTTYIYDPVGHLVMVQDPLGGQTQYGYDDRGLGISKTDAAGKVTTYSYDNNRNMTSVRDPLGNVSQYSYDQNNRMVSTTDPLTHTTSYSYDAGGHLLSTTDPLNRTISYTYDGAGRLLTETLPNTAVTTKTYDCAGNLKTVKDALGNTTTYGYDADNRQTSVGDPLNHSTTSTYDASGNQTQVGDALNLITRSAYDSANRLISETDPANATTAYAYDRAGNRTTVTDPANRVTTTAYDKANRPLTMTDPANAITTTTYGADGRTTQVKLASGNTTTKAYDPRGLVSSVTDSLNHVTKYGYDDAGRKISETDPNNATTTTAHDAAGHVISTTDALNDVVRFGYDAGGQRTSVSDARGKTTSYSFDPLGHVLTVKDPLNRSTSYQYDLLGHRTQTTDARGTVVGYTYDAAGNQTAETYPSNGSITWAYDAGNQRTSMTDVTGTTTWSYDTASRVTQVVAPQGTVGYSYNPDGRRATMSLPGGKTVNYGYDGAGRLNSVQDWQNRTVGFNYNVDGQKTGITWPNGVSTSQSYDAAGRLTGITHTGPNSTTLRHFSYTLDAAGNRTAVASEGGNESYTLDGLNRLTAVTYPQGDTASYSYDASGNRLTKTAGSTTTTYSYDDADQLLTDGTNSYTYDQNGNMLTGGSSVYTWDFANRLASAKVGSTTSSYSYDGQDTRVGKTTGGTTTPYLWDRQATLPLLASDGANTYLSDSNSLLGQLDASNAPSYYLDDALGSVRGQANASGALTGSGDYDVFGAARSGSTLSSTMGYAGQQTDPETGFSYLRARYYNPALGRFLSADTTLPNAPGTQGYNLYAYVANNPTTWADLNGHSPASQVANIFFSGLSLAAACWLTDWCQKDLSMFKDLLNTGQDMLETGVPMVAETGAFTMVAAMFGIMLTMIECALDTEVWFEGGTMKFGGCGGLAHNLQHDFI
ncbi:MAG: RHS repeat-associated core domain-containing protein, partial [Dehalococcoidia bacterium]